MAKKCNVQTISIVDGTKAAKHLEQFLSSIISDLSRRKQKSSADMIAKEVETASRTS